MKKSVIIFILAIASVCNTQEISAQTCGTRQLDPRIASFLKMIGYEDLSLEQLRKMPIEQIKFSGPPVQPYPREDVQRIKITADSIPVLVFNPTHAKKTFPSSSTIMVAVLLRPSYLP